MAISTTLRRLITEVHSDRFDLFSADIESGCVDPVDEPTEADILDELFDAACSGQAHVNPRGYDLTRSVVRELRELMIRLGYALPYDSEAQTLCRKADRLLFTHNGVQFEFGVRPTPSAVSDVLA